MNIWVLATGEPFPSDGDSPRMLRAGILVDMMANSGICVTWWNSDFDHTRKISRSNDTKQKYLKYKFNSRLLKGRPYHSNVSIARIINHKEVARDFSLKAPNELPPDIIFAAYPTIELCEAALAYARPRGIPVVVDIRDLWPDIFINLLPRWASWVARILLFFMFRSSRRVCAHATAITGITDSFVNWGVERAGRLRLDWDKAYPLAYRIQEPIGSSFEAGRAYWDEIGLFKGSPIVCFFGTLGRQFDIPCLIEAARILADTPFQIVICGTGDRLADYRQLASGLSKVYFPGWVDGPCIQALMERSLGGLAPYYNELSFNMSLPNKAIEYLAGGLPVISTLRGDLEALLRVNECGITTPSGNPQALANAIMKLLTDNVMREKMARNARKLYETYFVADMVYGQLIEDLCLIAQESCLGHA